jgi:Lyase
MISQGSQAYAKALAKAGVLDDTEAQSIADGLSKVADEWRSGSFEVKELGHFQCYDHAMTMEHGSVPCCTRRWCEGFAQLCVLVCTTDKAGR